MTKADELSRIADQLDWRKINAVVVVGYANVAHILQSYRSDLAIIPFDPECQWEGGADGPMPARNPTELKAMLVSTIRPGWMVDVIGEESLKRWGPVVNRALRDANTYIASMERSYRKNARKWAQIGFRVLPHLADRPIMNHLGTCLHHIPAVVVGAGPGLDKNIGILAEMSGRVCIVATDAAVGPLEDNNIQPHFICTLESHPLALAKIKDSPLWKDAYTVVGPHVHEQAWELQTKDILATITASGPVGRWLCQVIDCDTVHSGGSVSHTAYQVAERLGCSPIILIGMDSAFGEKTYAEGVRHASLAPTPADGGEVVSWGGIGTVKTSTQLRVYREWFEVVAYRRARENRMVVNATESGARIEHTVECKLRDVLSYLDDYGDIAATIDAEVKSLPRIDEDKLVEALVNQRRGAAKYAKMSYNALQASRELKACLESLVALEEDAYILSNMAVGPLEDVGAIPTLDQLDALERSMHRAMDCEHEMTQMTNNWPPR